MSNLDDTAKALSFLSDRAWHDFCDESEHTNRIPSGTTFLSQLLAHDMFMTEPCKNVYISRGKRKGVNQTVNLIEAPLMLTTIYGRTGVAEQLLYDEERPNRFNVQNLTWYEKVLAAPKFLRDPSKDWSYPVLADARNYSTPILAQLAYAFMAFHNGLVDAFERSGADGEDSFALARGAVLLTWFNIIKTDILDKTCRVAAHNDQLSEELTDKPWTESEFLSLGVFRCFHSLVRKEYIFNESTLNGGPSLKIPAILSAESRGPAVGSEYIHGDNLKVQASLIAHWLERWKVDWAMFFDDPVAKTKAKNLTGFAPRFSFKRPGRTRSKPLGQSKRREEEIQILDARKARDFGLKEVMSFPSVERGVRQLLQEVHHLQPAHGSGPQRHMNLSIALLAEGFFDSDCPPEELGKLGNVGSGVFRRQVNVAIAKANSLVDDTVKNFLGKTAMPKPTDLPQSFMEMIHMTRKNEFVFISKKEKMNV
ncbi:MAG: hypothetical protein ABJM43_20395 [Paracoccaceae bacterium]